MLSHRASIERPGGGVPSVTDSAASAGASPSEAGRAEPSDMRPKPMRLAPNAAVWAQHTVAAEILRVVARQCAAAGIAFLPVKGVVTSHMLYEDVAERPISDVDVRIRPRDFHAFRRMATDAGWDCLRVARTYRNLVYQFPSLSLDVEAQVGPPGLCALGVHDMLQRAGELHMAEGLRVAVPEIHDHAVLLTVNAFKDKIGTAAAPALEDLDRIVRRRDFRCEAFVDRAVESRTATIAWLVGSWMESRGSPEWSRLRGQLELRAPIRRAYGRLFQSLTELGHEGSLAMRLLARAGADAPLMRLQALASAAAWEGEMWMRSRASRTPKPASR